MTKLNEQQQQAVDCTEGPVVIIAGAGSGKTSTVIQRINHLIEQGVKPEHILAITFTNKAADELKERLSDQASNVHASTIHSLCCQLLRKYSDRLGRHRNFNILTPSDVEQILTHLINDWVDYHQSNYNAEHQRLNAQLNQTIDAYQRGELPVAAIDELKHRLKNIQISFQTITATLRSLNKRNIAAAISRAKNHGISASTYPTSAQYSRDDDARYVAVLFTEYQKYIARNNCFDFDDLLVEANILLTNCPDVLDEIQEQYQYIMVDEYQDINDVQEYFIRKLANKYKNICVVGDPDQSIYGWRGANVGLIKSFSSVYKNARVISLKTNYRSAQPILDWANTVISHNYADLNDHKPLLAAKELDSQCEIIRYPNDKIEAIETVNKIIERHEQGVPYSEMAVLYRISALSRTIESALVNANIPYELPRGVSFYERREIKDVLAYMTLLSNPYNELALIRAISVPNRGIGGRTIATIRQYGQDHQLNLLQAMNLVSNINILDARQQAIMEFIHLFQEVLTTMDDQPLEQVVSTLLERSGYLGYLMENEAVEDECRSDNVRQLLGELSLFDQQFSEEDLKMWNLRDRVTRFLTDISLNAQINDTNDSKDRVSLLTIHTAKGLEFSDVYIIGAEESILPSHRSFGNQSTLNEERRLMYVGITRAKSHLVITSANQRLMYGRISSNQPSRFLMPLIEPHDEKEE